MLAVLFVAVSDISLAVVLFVDGRHWRGGWLGLADAGGDGINRQARVAARITAVARGALIDTGRAGDNANGGADRFDLCVPCVPGPAKPAPPELPRRHKRQP